MELDNEGAPPNKWDIKINKSDEFEQKEITTKIPHTDSVELCRSCGGNQIVSCYSCQGNCKVKCSSCAGSGDEICYSCSLGYVNKTIYEYSSDGLPVSKIVSVSCTRCGGRGSITCSRCNGCKYIPCYTCNASGIVNCSTCDGREG